MFNDDNYYLMVYSAKHDGTANYRVDRMDHVEIVDEAISEKALTLREGIDSYTEQAFKRNIESETDAKNAVVG